MRLIDVGERLLAHAKSRKNLVLDGEPAQFVIDVPFVPVNCDLRELLPGDDEL